MDPPEIAEDPEVAVPLAPYPESTEKPSAVERKASGGGAAKKRFFFVVFVAIVLGAAVAAAIFFVKEFGNNDEEPSSSNSNVNNNPPNQPPTIPDVPAPTLSPTSLPPITTTTAPVMAAPVTVPEMETSAAPVAAPVTVTSAPVAAPVGPSSNSAETLRTALGPVVLDPDYLANSNTALEWLVSSAEAAGGSVLNLLEDQGRLVQRYALLSLDLVSQGSLTATTTSNTTSSRVENLPRVASGLDECTWVGVTCTNGTVTQIIWAEQFLKGSISANLGLLTGLVHLDLGENQLQGTIPDSLYSLVNLQYLYLHNNLLSGSLSESISNLFELRNLYLSDNQLTGALPSGIGSPTSGQDNVRPLRK